LHHLNIMDKKTKILTYAVIAWGLFLSLILILASFSQIHTRYNDVLTLLWIFIGGGYSIILIPFSLIDGIIRFIKGIIKGRKLYWAMFIPFVLSVIVFIGIMYFGSDFYIYVKDKQFERNLPKFEQIVKEIKSGELKPEEFPKNYYNPPAGFPSVGIILKKETEDIIIIYFGTSGATPYSRGGYVYISNDKPSQEMIKGFKLRKIEPCWYRFFG
jgi:hypothetical protein